MRLRASEGAAMGNAYLIERVRRDSGGAITHVSWYERKPHPVSDVVGVAVVISALRAGAQVNVVVGLIIGDRVQVSADGTTIVDLIGDHPKAFRLDDLLSM
jgi:hypothetical protein